jgi:hypothetical protein
MPTVGTWVGMVVWPLVFCGLAAVAFRSLRTEIRDLL